MLEDGSIPDAKGICEGVGFDFLGDGYGCKSFPDTSQIPLQILPRSHPHPLPRSHIRPCNIVHLTKSVSLNSAKTGYCSVRAGNPEFITWVITLHKVQSSLPHAYFPINSSNPPTLLAIPPPHQPRRLWQPSISATLTKGVLKYNGRLPFLPPDRHSCSR